MYFLSLLDIEIAQEIESKKNPFSYHTTNTMAEDDFVTHGARALAQSSDGIHQVLTKYFGLSIWRVNLLRPGPLLLTWFNFNPIMDNISDHIPSSVWDTPSESGNGVFLSHFMHV